MVFHGNIALPIETQINIILSESNYKIKADDIETGGFVTVLNFILFIKYGNDKKVIEFQKKYSKFIGLTHTEISELECEKIYSDFITITKNK